MNGDGRIALVTGANRGIGREVVRQLAEKGYTTILTARDAAKGEAAASELGVAFRRLDVADAASIEELAAGLRADPGRLDVLVNNAGAGFDFGVAGVDADFDRIEQSLRVNALGPWRLTLALLPLLRESPEGRIVNVSSGMGGVAEMGGWSPGYRMSKAGLNVMTRVLATELADTPIKVNSACPGFVATDMGAPMGAQKTVEDGAAGVVWLATLPADGPSGGFFRDGQPIAF
jgi:NAD(P)-dependent dehydrogenase (short-subunit alcohol dehydrogenase family)